MRLVLFFLMVVVFVAGGVWGEIKVPPANYDEAKVPQYTLPDPLRFESGRVVSSPDEWPQRRQEILRQFQDQMFGMVPPRPELMRYEVVESGEAFEGRAVRHQVRIWLSFDDKGPFIDLLLYLPVGVERAVPVFMGLNFYGNQAVCSDPAVRLCEGWLRNNEKMGIVGNRVTEKSRGTNSEGWQAEYLIEQGYGLATACYADIDSDRHDEFTAQVYKLFPAGESRPGNAWSAIGAWAWQLSRMMDYLQTRPEVDVRKVAVMGHSRLGKTALLAGALDERFAIVISNNSGCGGAALSKRCYGETVARIVTSFPHWFCGNFREYANNEGELPFDQHMLLACVAPRGLYVASAEDDRWADPRGEFLALRHAATVYAFLDLGSFPTGAFPAIDEPVEGLLTGYHCRAGRHAVLRYDWERYVAFADRLFGR